MQFLINVLPNNKFTQSNVEQFISNVEGQHYPNVTLIFKRNRSLTPSIEKFIKDADVKTKIVRKYSDVALNQNQHNYWLNLHVTDCLLPNAFTQWEQIIDRHSSDIVELTYLRNERSLRKQTSKIINKINHNYPVRVNTVKSVLNLPLNIPLFNLSLSSQLLILLGLQNYKVMDTIQRFNELNNSYLGNNVLIRVTQTMMNDFDKNGMANTAVNIIINRPEIIKINLPTVILSRFSLKNRINWLFEVANAANYIGDKSLLSSYKKFISNEITKIKKGVFHSNQSKIKKHSLVLRINQINKNLFQIK